MIGSLGSYRKVEEAAYAYQAEVARLHGPCGDFDPIPADRVPGASRRDEIERSVAEAIDRQEAWVLPSPPRRPLLGVSRICRRYRAR